MEKLIENQELEGKKTKPRGSKVVWAEPSATYLLVDGVQGRGWLHLEGNGRLFEGTSAGDGGKGESERETEVGVGDRGQFTEK